MVTVPGYHARAAVAPGRPAGVIRLQRKVASTSSAEALELLAESGRTKQIRSTARMSLKQQSNMNR
jgi:hypothetical protein